MKGETAAEGLEKGSINTRVLLPSALLGRTSSQDSATQPQVQETASSNFNGLALHLF